MPGIEVSRLEEGRFMGSSRPALVAEAIGTFLFFFVGAGSIVLGDYMVAAGGSGIGLLEVALAHGLALAVLVSALGAISGAHFNPAVTLGIWIMGRIPTPRAVAYVAAQLIGAAAAGFALKAAFADVWQPSSIGTPALGAGVSEMSGIAIEAVLTALLVLVVIGTAVDSRAPKIGGAGLGLAGARFGHLGLDRLGLFPGDALLPRLGGGIDEVLGLLEAQAGQFADRLDHQDLVRADLGQHRVELRLLLHCGGGPCISSGCRGSGNRHRGGRGDAVALLERLYQIGKVEDGHVVDRLENLILGQYLGHCSVRSLLSRQAAEPPSLARFLSATALSTPTRFLRLAARTPAIPAIGATMPPASLPSSTSRLGRVASRWRAAASTARFPSRPPRRVTTLLYGRRASCSAFARATSSPLMAASAVGPLSIGLSSARPASSAAIFSRRFLATCSSTPLARRVLRTDCMSETFRPR